MRKTPVYLAVAFACCIFGCEQQENDPEVALQPYRPSAVNEQTSDGSFSVLTYNVAGLPGFLSSGNPEENTAAIGQLVSDYDVVHVQEDFNYHATLYAHDDHPHRTPTSGGVPFGDGLNTLSNFAYTDFQRVKWNDCNGTDCLTPKGFSVARLWIRSGVFIDFYNAHPNAGVTAADLQARRSNITQLKNFIASFSAGNAVVVMGDLNCRYTRSEDNIRELTTLGLTDVWVELLREGLEPEAGAPTLGCENSIQYTDPQCEIVDKVFYRGNGLITLQATAFSYEEGRFRDANGDMLSDHRPIHVDFDWELDEHLAFSDQFGGPHGTPFNDVDLLPARPEVSALFLRAGSRVDQVGVSLTGGLNLVHGGNGGTWQQLTLQNGEYVREAFLCAGKKDGHTRIFRAEFRTSQNRTLAGGTWTSNNATFTAPEGWQIVGFHGRVGSEVDKLGVIYAPVD